MWRRSRVRSRCSGNGRSVEKTASFDGDWLWLQSARHAGACRDELRFGLVLEPGGACSMTPAE